MVKQKLKALTAFVKSYSFGNFRQIKQFSTANINRSKPANYTVASKPYFDHALQYTLPDVYVYIADKALIAQNGAIYVNGTPLKYTDTVSAKYKPLADVTWNNALHNIPKGKYIAIHTIWSDNYNHWLSEAFQKLYIVKNFLGSTINEYTILLPQNHNKHYIVESLKLAGISKVYFIPQNNYVIADDVISCTLAANTGNYNPVLLSAIRKDFYNALNLPGAQPKRNIYISRKKADKRFLLNEDDVINLVQKYGFEVLHFEDMPFAMQVTTMAATKNMIALHGAGLTNMMFMPTKANVLEMRLDGDTHMNLFYNLCDGSGLNYYYQLCKGDSNTKDVHAVNLTVDLSALEQNIQLMLAN